MLPPPVPASTPGKGIDVFRDTVEDAVAVPSTPKFTPFRDEVSNILLLVTVTLTHLDYVAYGCECGFSDPGGSICVDSGLSYENKSGGEERSIGDIRGRSIEKGSIEELRKDRS